MPPRTVGPWEILSVAGRGGVGTVYRARHRITGRLAAVKLLEPSAAADPAAARRLSREFEALHGLDHENVVKVLETGELEGWAFLAMELVEGLDLRSYLSPAVDLPAAGGRAEEAELHRADSLSAFSDEPDTESLLAPLEQASGETLVPRRGGAAPGGDDGSAAGPRATDPPAAAPELPPPSEQLLAMVNAPQRIQRLRDALAQVLAGLAYVHAHGLVHRDLKPSNIMVDDRRRVRIMDFGLVRLAHEAASLTLHGRVVGTYRYMAPEQARGFLVDARADLYSLGVILFELLCGRPPFLATPPRDAWCEIWERPPPSIAALNPRADRRLGYIAERLLQKDPAERFQSAEEILTAMRG